MATLLITKETGGYFSFVVDGNTADKVTNMRNDVLAIGTVCNFKTANGANIIKKQNINVTDITLVASGTFTFTNVTTFLNKLIDVGYYDWLLGGGSGTGVNRFDQLLDTFNYFGKDMQAVRVNVSEMKLETFTVYNYRNIVDLEDTFNTIVPNKMLATNEQGTAVVLKDLPKEPEQFLNAVGSFHYSDLATQTTPISVTAPNPIKLTNDQAGPYTVLSNAPFGVDTVWNSTLNSFDFSSLSIGDIVHLRPDLNIDLVGTNTSFRLYLRMGVGSASQYDLEFPPSERKDTSPFNYGGFLGFDFTNTDWINEPGELYFKSDANASIKVNGFYLEIIRKNVNIVNPIIEHNSATGIQGGAPDDYQHLTTEEKALALSGGGSTYYISKTGLDTNNGFSSKTPFLTIAKVLTVLANGDTVLFECGGEWFEPFPIDKQKITIASYSFGNMPIINGESLIATATLVSGSIYTTTNTYVSTDGNGRVVMFEDDVPMIPVANNTECQAIEGSYVAISGDTQTAGTYATVFHATGSGNPNSNGKRYTTNTRNCIFSKSGATDVKVVGIEAKNQWLEGGSIRLNFGENNTIKDCKAVNGNKHNAFINANSIGENIVAIASEYQGQYGKTATYFVAYDNVAPADSEVVWKNCSAINELQKVGVDKGKEMIGFLDHSGTGDYSKMSLLSCYTKGMGVPFNINAEKGYVIDGYFDENSSSLYGNNNGLELTIKNTFIRNVGANIGYNLCKGIRTYDNSVLIRDYFSATSFNTFIANNSIFFNEFRDSASRSYVSFTPESNTPTLISSFNSIYYGYFYTFCATTGTYEGDYNIFAPSTTWNPEVLMKWNGANIEDLSDWQTATGQDAHSVYLTFAQMEKLFITSPESGDIVLNPFCEVTASNGTVYKGTFPDGTKISDRISNKMFASNRKNGNVTSYAYEVSNSGNNVKLVGNQSISGVKTFQEVITTESDTLTVLTPSTITTATLTDGGYSQKGKVIRIENGTNNINFVVDGSTGAYVKGGTGTITFVQGSGRTLNGYDGLVLNGAVGSRASIVSTGTKDDLYIKNI